jgi:2-C-methyl-D-erythritol 4-phosphate cytidylyltransferase
VAVALIVAAGRGERLGSAGPKALVPLAGRPLLEWSVDAARRAGLAIVVALPEDAAAPSGTIGTRGGPTRSHSVRNALAAAPAADRVVVHDAARPLVEAALFERVLSALDGCDAATAGAPATDTLKEVDPDGSVRRTLDRATVWAVQTPQAFRRATLETALDVPDEVLAAATDDAWLVERTGGTVRVVDAGSQNIKVTTPTDLRVAELLLAERC